MKRAFTLMEITVYVFLFLLAGVGVAMLFRLGQQAQVSTVSSYLVSGQTETAIRWLRQDLQETALVSLRSYPNGTQTSEPPGCAFVSARNPSDQGNQLNVSPYGAPLWTKNVFYTLVLGSGARSGDLYRWERPLTAAQKDFVPHAPTDMPSSMTSADKVRRVVLREVLAPQTKVDGLGDAAGYKADQFGGFRVQFVQRIGGEGGNEQVTSANPGDTSVPSNPADNTSLVEVELKILPGDSSPPNLYDLTLRIHPHY